MLTGISSISFNLPPQIALVGRLLLKELKVLRDKYAKSVEQWGDVIREGGEIELDKTLVATSEMSIVGTGSSRLRLTEENIEHLFDATGRLLAAGEGLHRTYWKWFHDEKKPNEAKLELFAVMQQRETLPAITKAAKEEFDKLWMQHKGDIQKLSASIRTRFHALIQASGVPSVQDWELPDSIVEKKEGISWEKHVFCDVDGKFSAGLNGWETELLKDEMKRPDFVCWLRNVQRRDWAMCVPYGSPIVKSFYPDFVIVRKKGKEFLIDILEPHDASRGDTVPKAIGLAKFADEHGEDFGRLIIARKKGDKWQFADMNDKTTREKTKKMQPASDVGGLFE